MIGYCTNVHAGETLDEVVTNIRTYCAAVQQEVGESIELGLWLSNNAVFNGDPAKLKDCLLEHNLTVGSFNGFPFGDFHRGVVQHDVYEPTWCDERRLAYTKQLATLLAELLPANKSGGISTLPLGWAEGWDQDQLAACMLMQCVDFLEELEQKTGRCIHIDIEPEPGCRLQTSLDLSRFVQEQFDDEERIRRYLRVCYDTCHAAVMREDPMRAIDNYVQAGLKIGKVQLSSAVDVNFDVLNGDEKKLAVAALRSLAEPRYLHQTTVVVNGDILFFENLSSAPLENPVGHWRVHFHVPIHKKTIGPLGTTQDDLRISIPLLFPSGETIWEVETYTWSVMPKPFREEALVGSIASELRWANTQLQQVGSDA